MRAVPQFERKHLNQRDERLSFMEKKQAALIALIGGVVILAMKLVAYYVSNSVALLSDALESIVNILASGLMFFSVYVSEKPADSSHNYGHQKAEEISSMVEGLFIVAAALFIISAAVGRFFESVELLRLDLALGLFIVATALNGGLSWILANTARTKGSAALEGDAKHLLSDVISSVGVWIGLLIAQLTGWSSMDPLLACVVAAFVSRIGVRQVLTSSHRLMDQSCKAEEEKIREVLAQHKFRFIDFHNVRTRRHGNQVFADLHLTVDGSVSVSEAHDLTDHLEASLTDALPNMNVTIHIEPKP
jgi:cation diffusion facilitator family transporter